MKEMYKKKKVFVKNRKKTGMHNNKTSRENYFSMF